MQQTIAVPQRDLRPRLALLATAAITVFVWLAVSTEFGYSLAAYDPLVTAWAVSLRHGLVTAAAWALTYLGGTLGLTVLTTVTCTVLLLRGLRRHALVLAGAMIGSSLLTVLLKAAFARSRPHPSLLLGEPASSWSFPSGHAFNTGVFAGVLAGFVLFSTTAPARKAAATATACAVIVLVGLSRIYLAYHWFTDVLAGWSIALAWLCVVGVVVLTTTRRCARGLPAGGGPRAPTAVPGRSQE
ncbi:MULTISPECIES: phosphatase PAP2 family protein [unclassified Actinomyces]|uniref:phosphatase PAP2 family protein n=1 Tax=unclassified Actinomyces TaxID=2609248 RepID=UPI001374479D|nr:MULTISPECIES: phosphatase PAP2 family protein [unclassified Actinomyces]MBW3068623.1 phosphatase PAP2 family protein [Actinomyces sp. 594]NDR54022.1 phosphatase PAP2 family protein [Actinomyces sp. 565]QHO90807.1 phosphatidic acid phosphatase [Actinomyces sp. 432]